MKYALIRDLERMHLGNRLREDLLCDSARMAFLLNQQRWKVELGLRDWHDERDKWIIRFLSGIMTKKYYKWINGDSLYNIMNLSETLE